MFPESFGDLVRGWSKGFVSGAGNTPRSALIGISFWLSGLIMATIALTFLFQATGPVRWAVGLLYLLGVFQTLYLIRHAGNFWFIGGLLFPIGLTFYQVLFFRALRGKRKGDTVSWKGRDVA
ncbi:MAG: hypothetical protein AAGC68_07240 [Verrucomicrobiota bacterium]